MTVVVRADAGVELGTGHIVRCSALLRRLGIEPSSVVLVTGSLTPGIRGLVDSIGWQVRTIEGSAEEESDARASIDIIDETGDVGLLVVDHYRLGAQWENTVRESVGRLVVIDDLADRPHSCDVLIDPTLTEVGSDRHAESVVTAARLVGPQYALLDPDYDSWKPRERHGQIGSWLVYLGGATSAADVIPLLTAFSEVDRPSVTLTVVLGRAFVGADEVRSVGGSLGGVWILDWTDRMPTLLSETDCAIGAPGGAQWERCALGVPTLTVLTASNQEHDALAFEAAGATRHLGPLTAMTVQRWRSAFEWAYSHPADIEAMSRAASAVVADRQDAWASAIPAILGTQGNT
jgi:UDP-2,4-diacetamido-2,4,6-trideoxy-beta-L-altropyranose hydrolase